MEFKSVHCPQLDRHHIRKWIVNRYYNNKTKYSRWPSMSLMIFISLSLDKWQHSTDTENSIYKINIKKHKICVYTVVTKCHLRRWTRSRRIGPFFPSLHIEWVLDHEDHPSPWWQGSHHQGTLWDDIRLFQNQWWSSSITISLTLLLVIIYVPSHTHWKNIFSLCRTSLDFSSGWSKRPCGVLAFFSGSLLVVVPLADRKAPKRWDKIRNMF